MSRPARASFGFASTAVRRAAKIHQPQAGAVALGKGVEERIEELEARLAERGVGDAQPKWLRCVRATGRDSLHSRSPPDGHLTNPPNARRLHGLGDVAAPHRNPALRGVESEPGQRSASVFFSDPLRKIDCSRSMQGGPFVLRFFDPNLKTKRFWTADRKLGA